MGMFWVKCQRLEKNALSFKFYSRRAPGVSSQAKSQFAVNCENEHILTKIVYEHRTIKQETSYFELKFLEKIVMT